MGGNTRVLKFNTAKMVGKCLYYLGNGIVLFAEGGDEPAVKKDGDGNFVFDCDKAVSINFGVQPLQASLMRDSFPGNPTFYIAEKSDVRAQSDMTNENLLQSLRGIRAGLILTGKAPDEPMPEPGRN